MNTRKTFNKQNKTKAPTFCSELSLLLPKPEIEADEYEENPKDRLIKRLLEYKNYKEMISKFQQLQQDRSNYYTKSPCDVSDLNIAGTLDDDVCFYVLYTIVLMI